MPAGQLILASKRKPRRRHKTKKKTVAVKANKALKAVRAIRKFSELKFFDVAFAIVDNDWLGSVRSLCVPPQGFTDSQRIGDKIFMTSLILRYKATIGTSNNNSQLRVIIFYDKQDTINFVADLLLATGTNRAPYLTYSKDNRHQFTVLYDKTHNIKTLESSVVSIPGFMIKLGKMTQFEAGGVNISSGALKMALISSIDAANNDNDKPNFVGTTRVFYRDS